MEFRRVLFRSVVIENSPVTNDVLTAARSAVPERIEHYFVTSPAARERLLAAGIATDRITELPAAPAERTAATMTVMGRLLAQNLKLIRSESSPIRRRLEQMAIGAMEIPRLRRLLCAKVERYDDVPGLREALDRKSKHTSELQSLMRISYAVFC